MNNKIPINVTIDPGSLSISASPIFQNGKNTYLCPFCVTKLEKFEYEYSDCHHKMDWSRWTDKNVKHDCGFSGGEVL